MKNLIVTACDAKYGAFLINHWLKSLKTNVNLQNIDILVLDYGLTHDQTKELNTEGVIVKKCKRDGHVVNIRYRDIADFLLKHKYDQILSTDCGDIIFQEDISHLFNENKKKFRAAVERAMLVSFFNRFMKSELFEDKLLAQIRTLLKDKKVINGGFILGPSSKFSVLSKKIYFSIKDKNKYGPDQILINYFLYKRGFVELDHTYNFVFLVEDTNFKIKKGVFYFEDGKKIAVPHNAGGTGIARFISKFGFGPRYNKLRRLHYYSLRIGLKFKKLHQ